MGRRGNLTPLKRFAFDKNQKTSLTFCFFAHFIQKPRHTFRNAPLVFVWSAADKVNLHRSVLPYFEQAVPRLGTEMRHVDCGHRIGGAHAKHGPFRHLQQQFAGFQHRQRAEQRFAIKGGVRGQRMAFQVACSCCRWLAVTQITFAGQITTAK